MAKALSRFHDHPDKAKITLNLRDRTVLIESMLLEEQETYDVLAVISPDRRVPFVRRAVRVGIIALKDVNTAEKVDYVQREFDRLREELDHIFTQQLGPGGMKGDLQKIFGDKGELHSALEHIFGEDGTLMRDIFDPGNESTPVGRLRKMIESYFAGKESVVYGMLDPHKTDSPLNRLRTELMAELSQIRTDLNKYIVRTEIVEETTKKGFEFEDKLEVFLQELARPFGDLVERVSTERGKTGSLKGDFTISIRDPTVATSGLRIVVEAKAGEQDLAITSKGLLGYLDESMQNREAQLAIAVSKKPWQAKVGRYQEYQENKILCEFAEDGLPVEVAYRVGRVRLLLSHHKEAGKVDTAKIDARIGEIKTHLETIQGIKARLSSIESASQMVKQDLDSLREKVLASLEEINQAMIHSL